jgi:hypothetical protein
MNWWESLGDLERGQAPSREMTGLREGRYFLLLPSPALI